MPVTQTLSVLVMVPGSTGMSDVLTATVQMMMSRQAMAISVLACCATGDNGHKWRRARSQHSSAPQMPRPTLYTISCVIAVNAANMPAELDVFTSFLRLSCQSPRS